MQPVGDCIPLTSSRRAERCRKQRLVFGPPGGVLMDPRSHTRASALLANLNYTHEIVLKYILQLVCDNTFIFYNIL